MSDKIIITIARQFGSGGHEVAKKVAEILSIPFYDKDIIVMAAKESGLSEKIFEGMDEKPTNSLLYSLVMGLQSGSGVYNKYGDATSTDSIFRIQSQVIRDVAAKSSCVIVGRCSDYVLREQPGAYSFFVHADIGFRTKRIMERYDLEEKPALDQLNKTDKRRSSFYNFYTGNVWGNSDNYDMSVRTDKIGIDNAAEMIVDYIKKQNM